MGDPALPTTIQKEKGFTVYYQYPNLPLCGHLIEIANPWFIRQQGLLLS
jgi:hypothetical protein